MLCLCYEQTSLGAESIRAGYKVTLSLLIQPLNVSWSFCPKGKAW